MYYNKCNKPEPNCIIDDCSKCEYYKIDAEKKIDEAICLLNEAKECIEAYSCCYQECCEDNHHHHHHYDHHHGHHNHCHNDEYHNYNNCPEPCCECTRPVPTCEVCGCYPCVCVNHCHRPHHHCEYPTPVPYSQNKCYHNQKHNY